MKLPRDLNGDELMKMLCREFGYRQVNQEGSHVILETDHPAHQRLAVPNHKPLRLGTLNAILNSVARVQGVTKDELIRRL